MPSTTQSRAVRLPDGATSPCADLCLKAWHANSYSLQRYNISIKIQLPRLFYRIRNRHNAASHHSATTIWPADSMLPSKQNAKHYFNLFLILHLYDLTFHFSQSGEIETEKKAYQKTVFRQSENISRHTRMQKRPYCIAKQYISWHEIHRIMPWYRLFHWLIQTISQDEEKYTALRFKRKRITISWLLTNVQSRYLSRKIQPTWFDFKIRRFQRNLF